MQSFFERVRKLSLSFGSPDVQYFSFLAFSLAMKALSSLLFHQNLILWHELLISLLSLLTQHSILSEQDKVVLVWLSDMSERV